MQYVINQWYHEAIRILAIALLILGINLLFSRRWNADLIAGKCRRPHSYTAGAPLALLWRSAGGALAPSCLLGNSFKEKDNNMLINTINYRENMAKYGNLATSEDIYLHICKYISFKALEMPWMLSYA